MVNILLYVITYLTTTKSQCNNGNGCNTGGGATCDVEFVDNAVYGCGGIWENAGVSNGEYLCADGYSICKTASYAASLGLTKELCTSTTLMVANNFYASLQSGPGSLRCDASGVDDLFGCASPDSDPGLCYFGDQTNVIHCGPFGAQMSTHSGNKWKYGWEGLWCNDGGSEELICAKHLKSKVESSPGANDWYRSDSIIQGGVICCKDGNGTDAPTTTESIDLPTEFSQAQKDRIDAWKSRTVYQILTDRFSKTNNDNTGCADLSVYCGGTFKGIQNQLDYIQGMGYDAIWISPVIENTANGYHGYWAKNLYDINSNFGTESDLLALVDALHDRDMYLMIDVVFNHMGYVANDNYTSLVPFNDAKYYHDSCNNPLCDDTDKNNKCDIHNWQYYTSNGIKEIEQCRLAGLPDLDQSNDDVLDLLCDWLSEYVIDKWLADAIRIDTVPEINIKYWSDLLGNNTCLADDIFNIGEYFQGDPAIVGQYQPVFDSLFGYPMYYTMLDVFGNGKTMQKIEWRLNEYENKFIDYSALGLFTDNHDNDRWLCTFKDKPNKITNYQNALLFMYTFPGIPIGYYGTEQSFSGCKDPENREVLWTTDYNTETVIYQYISTVIKYRKEYKIYDGAFNVLQSEKDLFVFNRGNTLIVLTNNGNTFNRSIAINNKIIAGTYCDVFDNNDCFEYGTSKNVGIWIKNGMGKLYVAMNKTETIVSTQYYDPSTTVKPTDFVDGIDMIYGIHTLFMTLFFVAFLN